MTRALIVALVSGIIVAPVAVPSQALGDDALAVRAPAPDATPGASACTTGEGQNVAQAQGCCQRQGGLCRCRQGTPICCDGSAGMGCRCRDGAPLPDGASWEPAS